MERPAGTVPAAAPGNGWAARPQLQAGRYNALKYKPRSLRTGCDTLPPMHFAPTTRLLAHFPRQLAILALACCAALAHADEYSAVEKLLKSGRAEQALEQITDKAGKAPRDPQWRFLRGMAEANLGRTEQAIATYTQLTQEYPELPEPYNNLAVLYAGQNQLEKASAALQSAIRANPQYAVAHENLGDIYIKLAQQSFAQAIKLAPAQQARLQPKINSLQQLVVPAQAAAGSVPAQKNPALAP